MFYSNEVERVSKMRSDLYVTAKNIIEEINAEQWHDELFMRAQLGQVDYKLLNNISYQICILQIRQTETGCVEPYLLSRFRSMIVALFEQCAYRVFVHVQQQQLVLLLFDIAPALSRKEQLMKKELLKHITRKIHCVVNQSGESKFTSLLGVSSVSKGFKNTQFCYEEAKKALSLQRLFQNTTIFYEEIGAFQLLLHLQEHGMLASYVVRHLGPILEEDERKKSDLFNTLKVYLASNGSKQSVADELHIVRQSLYYRLEKIKELLGDDYMCTQNRLALQLAIQAYALLEYSENSG